MTITEFLLARIAEDEKRAGRSAEHFIAGRLTANLMGLSDRNGYDEVLDAFTEASSLVVAAARGEVDLDPARVLAECAAKRRIVEALPQKWSLDLTQVVGIGTDVEFDWWEDRDGARHDMRAEPPPGEVAVVPEVLCLLALPYADHPDYDEAWRP